MDESRKKKKVPNYERRITEIVLAIFMFALGIYINVASGILFDLEAWLSRFIESQTLKFIVLALIQLAVFEGLYHLLRECVATPVGKLLWRMRNKRHYLKGAWLHIHDKAKARIGVVDVEQKFFDLKVTATNVEPKKKNSESSVKTNWYYLATEFNPNGSLEDKLVGCYLAHREGENNKYGLHLFTDAKYSPYPEMFEGRFGDVLKPADLKNPNAANDRTGKIYWYKMPPCIKRYIGYKDVDSFDRNKLSTLITDVEATPADQRQKRLFEKIKATDFYKKLKSVLEKNECRKRYNNINERINDYPDLQKYKYNFDVYFARILCNTVLCDRDLANQERETLNYILGTNWDETFINNVFLNVSSNEPDDPDANTFIVKLRLEHNDLWYSLRDVVISTVTCLIHSDNKVVVDEKKCLDDINKLFGVQTTVS